MGPGCQLGLLSLRLLVPRNVGLSKRLLGLPHNMAPRFQEQLSREIGSGAARLFRPGFRRWYSVAPTLFYGSSSHRACLDSRRGTYTPLLHEKSIQQFPTILNLPQLSFCLFFFFFPFLGAMMTDELIFAEDIGFLLAKTSKDANIHD